MLLTQTCCHYFISRTTPRSPLTTHSLPVLLTTLTTTFAILDRVLPAGVVVDEGRRRGGGTSEAQRRALQREPPQLVKLSAFYYIYDIYICNKQNSVDRAGHPSAQGHPGAHNANGRWLVMTPEYIYGKRSKGYQSRSRKPVYAARASVGKVLATLSAVFVGAPRAGGV